MNIELNKLVESKLDPNDYIVLLYLNMNSKEELWFNYETSLESLTKKKYIDENRNLTSKAKKLFQSSILDLQFHESKKIEDKALTMATIKFIQIFPPIILPSGSPARGGLLIVKNRLKSFIENYQYDWDIIYSAANNYVKRYAEKNYKFMRNCPNFIFNSQGESLLALECDIVQHSNSESGMTI